MHSARQFIAPALAALAFVMTLAACNDDPTPIGSDLLSQNVTFHSYVLKPTDFEIISGTSIASNSSAQGGATVVVGRTDDGITAHGLLAITTHSTLLSGSDAKPIKTATLTFRTGKYRIGDTSSRQLSFDVVELNEVFSSTGKWDQGLASRIASAPSLGTFTGTFNDDTTLIVTLDVTATSKFLQEYFRLDNGVAGQEFVTLKTLALRARSDGHIAAALTSTLASTEAYRPYLSFTVADGTPDDTTLTLPIGSTSWIADAPLDAGAGHIVVMGGVSARTLIRLRLDSIPSTAAIHGADLRLTIDTVNSHIGTLAGTSYMIAYLAADSSLRTSSYLSSGITGVFPVYRIPVVEGDTARFTNVMHFTTLTPAISSWMRYNRGASGFKNEGVILALNRGSTGDVLESSTLDRYVFFGTDAADPSKRPALTIYYSLETDAR